MSNENDIYQSLGELTASLKHNTQNLDRLSKDLQMYSERTEDRIVSLEKSRAAIKGIIAFMAAIATALGVDELLNLFGKGH